MATPRFYSPQTIFKINENVRLTERARHHAGRVLRLVAGSEIVLFNGLGDLASGPIEFEGKDAFMTVKALGHPDNESPVKITLIQSLVSPEKLDWIAEKSVELGVCNLILTQAERSITKLSGDRLQKRLTHLEDKIISACEQSGRNIVPTIRYLPFDEVLTQTASQARFLLAPASTAIPKLTGLKSVAFAIGPEGGFSEKEISAALEAGWESVLIGPRVLRTETAGIVAAALANAASGDMRFL